MLTKQSKRKRNRKGNNFLHGCVQFPFFYSFCKLQFFLPSYIFLFDTLTPSLTKCSLLRQADVHIYQESSEFTGSFLVNFTSADYILEPKSGFFVMLALCKSISICPGLESVVSFIILNEHSTVCPVKML